MRASVASITKKFISTFFAATLALGLVPAAAFAANDENSEPAEADRIEMTSEDSDAQETSTSVDESQEDPVGASFMWRNGEDEPEDSVSTGEDSNPDIPAALERINEDVALTQPVAQQESTRSYFLAQTLESTKTVPIVSANLPLDKGTSSDVTEPEAEGEGSSEGEGDDESDDPDSEGDLAPVDASFSLHPSNADSAVSAESTVIGSFTYLGTTYAVEPGGETVAAVVSDYSKLPERFVEEQTIVLPSAVTADYIDYYSVTRIADYAFASLASEEEGITILGIPSSITSIGDDAFAGFETLQYVVVEEGNPAYASYDGALYSADLTNLRLIPEGRVGTIRVAPSATTVDPEAFSHCPSVDTVVADPESEMIKLLFEMDLDGIAVVDVVEGGYLYDQSEERDRFAQIEELLDTSHDSVSKDYIDFTDASSVSMSDSVVLRNLASANSFDILPAPQNKYGSVTVYSNKPFKFDCKVMLYSRGQTVLNTPLINTTTLNAAVEVNTGKYYGQLYGHYKLIVRNTGKPTASVSVWFCGKDSAGEFIGYDIFSNFVCTELGYYFDGRIWLADGLHDDTSSDFVMDDTKTYPDTWCTATLCMSASKTSARFVLDSDASRTQQLKTQTQTSFGPNDAWHFTAEQADSVIPAGYQFDCFELNGHKLDVTKTYTFLELLSLAGVEAGLQLYDLDIIVKTKPKTSNLTFDLQSGAWKSGETLKSPITATYGSAMPGVYKSGTTTKMTVPTRTGKLFAGFYDKTQGSTGATMYYTSVLASNRNWDKDTTAATTFYAWWTDKTSNLTFDLQGATSGTAPTGKTATYGSAMPTYGNTAPTKTGYTFGGFYDTNNSTGGGNMYYKANLDSNQNWNKDTTTGTTLYARWNAKTSALSFDLQNGAWKSGETLQDTTTATYGSAMPGIYRKNTSTTMTVPTRTGKLFAGFYDKTQGSTGATMYYTSALASNQNWNKDTTAATILYAWWTDKTATLKFDLDGGTGGGTITGKTATYGSAMPTTGMTVPIKTGKVFNGYYTTKNCGGTKYYGVSDGSIVSANSWAMDTTAETTLYAGWTDKTSNLTFNLQGGAWKSGETLKSPITATYGAAMPGVYKSGTTITMTVPTKTGKLFAGFYDKTQGSNGATMYYTSTLASNQNWDKDTTAATELYAWWTDKTSNLSFNLQGGSWKSGETLKSPITATYGSAMPGVYKSGTTITMSVPEKAGYTFAGFYDAATNGNMYYTSVLASNKNWDKDTTSSTELHAHWTYKTSALTFDLKGGSWKNGETLQSNITATYNSAMPGVFKNGTSIKMSIPEKTGYTFAGFYDAETAGNMYYRADLSSNQSWNKDKTEGTTLYAHWTNNPYTITYKGNTNTGGSTTATNATYDENVTLALNGFTKTGYHFDEWNTAANGSGTGYAEGSTLTKPNFVNTKDGNQDLYAIWKANSYKIVYDKNGATGGSTADTPATYDQDVKLATSGFSWPGHTFKEWNTERNGSGVPYSENATLTTPNFVTTENGSKTLYAIWMIDTYAINYEMNNHGVKPTSLPSWTYGAAPKLPDPEKVAGYTFGGWYWNQACSNGQEASITATTQGPITVYAKWTLNTWKVSWNFDGAEGKTNYTDSNVAYNSTFTLVDPGSKAGYSFTGWKASGTDTNAYDKGYSYTMKDGDVTFTAQWSAHPYTTVNLSDPYLSEPAAQGTIYYWPERGYVQSADSTEVKTTGIVTPPDLSRLGYKFEGWYSVEAQTENGLEYRMIDANGNMVKTGDPSPNTDDGAVVWYAHWTRPACPVVLAPSYVVNEGEAAFAIVDKENLTSISRATFGTAFSASYENGRIPESLLPKRVGYTFMGYYTGKNAELSVADSKDASKYNGKQRIAADGTLSSDDWNEPAEKRQPVTLYAAWRLDECEVTFNVTSNVNPSVSEPVTVASAPASKTWYYGKPKSAMTVASADTFERHGYAFAGWYYLDGSDKVFVSDKDGNPTPVNWDVVKTSVTLYPAWTAKEYTVQFDDNFPALDGSDIEGSKAFEPVTVAYDSTMLDLSDYVPTFGDYEFAGWYTTTEQLFVGAHMTSGRFTPRGAVAQQNPIRLHAIWTAPGVKQYHFYVKYPGTDEIIESVHDYYYTDTVKFNGTEAPIAPAGWRFEGWVKRDSDAEARTALTNDTVGDDEPTVGGFGPYSKIDRFFVAKWSKRPLSVTFLSEKTDDTTAWLTKADRLKDYAGTVENENAISWEQACEGRESRPDLASGLSYDVDMAPFVLPDVVRKGQVFKGWRLLSDSDDHAKRGIVVDPQDQKTSEAKHDLVYVPVFEDAIYTIVLDGNGYGQDQRFENVAYSDTFEFPYPIAKTSGAAFVCWAADTNTTSDGTETFEPLEKASVAPVYDEAGETVERFGLAQLDKDDTGIIRLYAVWHAKYNVELPLFANLAIDTERGDVIAGTNTISFTDHDDTDAIYSIESVRYEPMSTNDHVAFEGAEDKVYLSVYAGLNTGDATDLEHLLYAENIDKDGGTGGEVTYTDASGNLAKAKPLLIELGGDTPVIYGRTAHEGQPSLEGVTDTEAPYGFVPFGHANPLTIRYGLYFENPQTLKDFAGGTKYQWLLPGNDGSYQAGSTSADLESANYGRRTAWSGDAVNIAKLRYTVSVSNTK